MGVVRYKMKYAECKKYKEERIKCSWCGRFISYDALYSGKAYHTMSTPDSDYTFEEWESCCKECNDKDIK